MSNVYEKMNIGEAVIKAIDQGKAEDLYEIVAGISEFCLQDASDAVPIDEGNRRYWQLAMDHLMFIAEFGQARAIDAAVEKLGEHEYFSYPREFAKWIELGCPGLSASEILTLLEKQQG